jgi:hypothetical protein
VNPGNACDPPGKTQTDGLVVTVHSKESRCAQLLKHLHFASYPALFASQVPLLARRIFTAIWVLLGNDSLLLAST